MTETNQVQNLVPEPIATRKLLEMVGSNGCSPALFMDILDLLGAPHSTLADFLQRLLDKLNELIPSSSSLIGLVVGESGAAVPKVVICEGEHRIGAMGGRHSRLWPDYPIGGEALPSEQRSLIGYVAFQKQAIILSDVQQWKHDTGFYREVHEGINSEIAVPILLEGRDVLGVINLESTEKNYYKAEHLDQLQWVACVISRHLYAFMNRAGYRKPYLTTLDNIHKELNGLRINPDFSRKALKYLSEDSKVIFDAVAASVAGALNSERCEVWVQTKNREKLLLEGQYGTANLTEAELALGLEEAKQAMEQKSARSLDGSSSPNGEAVLVTPLLVSGRTYGVVRVMSPTAAGEARRYSLGDERLLDVLQQPVAIAIHQKHLEWERRAAAFKRGKDVAVLVDIIRGIDAGLDTVLQQTCDKISELCDALHCSIFMLDDATRKFKQVAATNLPAGFLNKRIYEPGEGLTGWVGKCGKSLNLRTRRDQDLIHIQPPIDWNNAEKLRHEDLIDRPFIAVPIQLKGRTVGVLRCTDKGGELSVFTEADEHVLQLIAAQLAIAITLQQQHEGKTKLFRGLKVLLAAVKEQREMSQPARIEESLLENVLEAARYSFGADAAILYRYRQGVVAEPITSGQLEGEACLDHLAEGGPASFNLLEGQGDICFFPDATNQPCPARAGAPQAGQHRKRPAFPESVRSAAVAKLGSGQYGEALLLLTYRQHAQTFNRQFAELFAAFADVATLCIDIFDMRLDSLEIAARLHNAIIPELMRDVVAEAGLGTIHLRQKDYPLVADYFDAIETSAQQTVAALSDVVCRLIRQFKGLGTQPEY